jgi:predicted nucleic acid-binding protein
MLLVDLLRNQKQVATFLSAVATKPSASVVTLMELVAGARSQKEEHRIEILLSNFQLWPVSDEIAMRAGGLLRHYRASHGLDAPDALIAATAEHHQLPLATLNLKHFLMFPKLKAAY